MSIRRIAVTGASGFLGSAIVRVASMERWPVVAVTRQPWAVPPNVSAETRVAGLTDEIGLRESFKGVDAVFHCAGLAHQRDRGSRGLESFQSVNVTGSQTVARAASAAGVGQMILISSVSVYGPHQEYAGETDPCRPDSPYGRSKLEAEAAVLETLQNSPMALTILRMTTLYGPGDPGNVLRLIRSVDRGRFVWIGRCENRKTLMHVEDAADACLAAAANPRTGIYNVACEPQTMAEIVREIGEALNRIPRIRIPEWWVRQGGNMLTHCRGWAPASRLWGDLARFLADDLYDGSRFRTTFRFAPRIPFFLGIAQEVAWYRQQLARCI